MRQETLLKIVSLMRKELDHGLTILGISRKLRIGYRPAYIHIKEMEKEGIVIITKIGNAMQCLLNLKNVKTRHLLEEVAMIQMSALFEKNPRLKQVLDSLVPKLTTVLVAHIHSIVLFGSFAKETATKTSDIDLLFIVSELKNKEVRGGIERECTSYQYSHKARVSPLITDIEQFKKMLLTEEMNIGKEARKYGIPVYGSEMFLRLIS